MWWKRRCVAKEQARQDARGEWWAKQYEIAREKHPELFEPVDYQPNTCGTCLWWRSSFTSHSTAVEFEDGRLHEMYTDRMIDGECHKDGPRAFGTDSIYWPATSHDNSCGAWMEKP